MEFAIQDFDGFFLRFFFYDRRRQVDAFMFIMCVVELTLTLTFLPWKVMICERKYRLHFVCTIGHGLHQILSYSFLMTVIRISFPLVSESIKTPPFKYIFMFCYMINTSIGKALLHKRSKRGETLPDDGRCGQPKRLVVSNKKQIYKIRVNVFIG